MMDLATLTKEVTDLTRKVGAFIRQEGASFNHERIEYKGLNDLVSYVDKTAEVQLVVGLSKLIPSAGFVTEEKTINKVGKQYNWIIDPLDGTTNFIHGIPTFAISIALQLNDELVLGVVYEINRDECFYAWKNGGAFLNGHAIQTSKAPYLSNTLLATGFPYYDFSKQEPYLKLFQKLMQQCHGLRRFGSAAVDLAYVACGRFDGYFEYNLNAWDVAGGIVLVREAGGEIVDFSGGNQPIELREIIATNGHISVELLGIIKEYFN